MYPPKCWKDLATYIQSSETVEEICEAALANSFTYFMDKHNKERRDKNNKETRGEGTSAQGALSASTTRTNGFTRSAKSKGMEPEVIQPITMSEDAFELVMGMFEKCSHGRTEFLHHGEF
jgi:enhancer of polycomb-like protein